MKNESRQLFVYGSLRSGFQHAAYQYMAKYFQLSGHATVKGKLYDMGDYPVALPTIEEKFIQGELYTLNEADDFSYVIGQLDDYEGLYAEEGETPLYKRELATVFCNGQSSTAWIYWFNGNVNNLQEIESGDVLEFMRQKNKL
ncbi:gamma-glutamylcyclotransferase family protein [Ferruginibacter sp.]|nr:gamma-glutamylcyclotransferase [Ferruginibacter sp.]